ncbi:hypothetical protein G6F50_014824 [Rhizopus delemar]|uniref:Uncharacterized protein n=1 Tax=Rhizopus delemar TaxID=936053 RepID=A0A9P6Y2H4_9FUNG|nr:hypothetical protein G6F50_014824 [Rhizopus delemar]
MACATGQAHRRGTQLVGRGLDRVHHQRRTVRGLRAAQLREACRQAQRLQVVGQRGHQRFRERVQHGVAVAAHFQRQLHPAGHGVGGVRRHRQAAHRGHHVMRIAAGGAGLAAGGIDDAVRPTCKTDRGRAGLCQRGVLVQGLPATDGGLAAGLAGGEPPDRLRRRRPKAPADERPIPKR